MKQCDALGFYALLDVSPFADAEMIKIAYHEKAKYWHPDQNTMPQALDIFQKISVAYDTLKDAQKRLQYDLLSLVYEEKDFPTLGSLKVYKNQHNQPDKSLRVLRQRRVTNGKVYESKDICNMREANAMVLNTSIHNWLYGWWGKHGFSNTIHALKFNLQTTATNKTDNFKLLIHNAVAYKQENNSEMAWIYAKQAQIMQQNNQQVRELLEEFIDNLNYTAPDKIKIPFWNATDLRLRQYLFPLTLISAILLLMLLFIGQNTIVSWKQTQQPLYSSETVSPDMLETKVMKIESSITSTKYLIHLTNQTDVYYAPGKQNDVITTLQTGKTLRITGYTFDKKWYQIIMDNGDKGYIQSTNTAIGIGDPVPYGSRVYKE